MLGLIHACFATKKKKNGVDKFEGVLYTGSACLGKSIFLTRLWVLGFKIF